MSETASPAAGFHERSSMILRMMVTLINRASQIVVRLSQTYTEPQTLRSFLGYAPPSPLSENRRKIYDLLSNPRTCLAMGLFLRTNMLNGATNLIELARLSLDGSSQLSSDQHLLLGLVRMIADNSDSDRDALILLISASDDCRDPNVELEIPTADESWFLTDSTIEALNRFIETH